MHQGDERRVRWRTPARWGAGLVLGVGAALVWSGCSIEKNYEALSFFFDGVPDPKAVRVTADGERAFGDLKASPTYTAHRPYVQDQCAECHGGRFRLGMNDSAICLKCHASVTTAHDRMHGPVAAGACLWCHHPHESAQASLLRNPSRKVCTQCHDAKLLNAERVPEHAEAGRDCLECHSGHGGASAYFLKARVDPGSGGVK